jgi:hypothetical protein
MISHFWQGEMRAFADECFPDFFKEVCAEFSQSWLNKKQNIYWLGWADFRVEGRIVLLPLVSNVAVG